MPGAGGREHLDDGDTDIVRVFRKLADFFVSQRLHEISISYFVSRIPYGTQNSKDRFGDGFQMFVRRFGIFGFGDGGAHAETRRARTGELSDIFFRDASAHLDEKLGILYVQYFDARNSSRVIRR